MNDYLHLIALEKELHRSEVRSDSEKMSAYLSPSFFEFGSSGKVWKREDILRSLSMEKDENEIHAHDFKTTGLSKDIVLLTYVSQRIVQGKISKEFLRSSIWQKFPDGWKMVFHQGTPK